MSADRHDLSHDPLRGTDWDEEVTNDSGIMLPSPAQVWGEDMQELRLFADPPQNNKFPSSSRNEANIPIDVPLHKISPDPSASARSRSPSPPIIEAMHRITHHRVKRPPHFTTLHRLRSPWHAQEAHMSPDTISIVDSVTWDPGSVISETTDQATTNAASTIVASEEPSTRPIARPFLSLHVLRTISHVCAEHGTITCFHVSGGLVVVGLSHGATLVFDMSQRHRATCMSNTAYGDGHAVTALSVSQEATYVGVGHASGHIFLYDLFQADEPARHVPPIDPTVVRAGRGEGHFEGSPITHLYFVGARKTAILSTDAHGLCIYHSLGRMLGMASNDTLRIYGQYSLHDSPHIFDAMPLPVGTTDHPSNAHRFVALLLSDKLLLIGLQPSARTWYRSTVPESCQTAALAWFPAIVQEKSVQHPLLAFAFGSQLRLLHVRSVRVKPRSPEDPATSAIVMAEDTLLSAPSSIVRLQWVHRQLLFVVTDNAWLLYDMRKNAYTEWQPHDPIVAQHMATSSTCALSLYVWRSKAFLLAEDQFFTGDFLPWDARLQELEQAQDWYEALRLGLDLYHGTSLGSGIGLPDSRSEQKYIIAKRLQTIQQNALRLLSASPADAHTLVHLCGQVAIATADETFLYGDLYWAYEQYDMEEVYVHELEQFILRGQLHTPPPSVVQRLIAFRDRRQEYEEVSQLILHVDPLQLDLDQVLRVCSEHGLWGPMAHVCEHVMHDYVTPVAYLLSTLCTQLLRHEFSAENANLYAIFPLLSAYLRGLRYPSLTPMEPTDAVKAASDIMSCLFSKGPFEWVGHGAIPTLDHKPYPYLRLVWSLDSEPFFDGIDLAFETDIFGDERPSSWLHRQTVVQILLEACQGPSIPEDVSLFTALFVARNAAKYPQFVSLSDQQVQWVFTVLTSDVTNHMDSEYALECILSVHPIQLDETHITALRRATFWHIYEQALFKAHQFNELFRFYLLDLDGSHHAPGQLYARIAEMLSRSGLRKAAQRDQFHPTLVSSVADVPDSLLGDLAQVVSRYFVSLNDAVLDELNSTPQRQYLYLTFFFSLDQPSMKNWPIPLRRLWMTRLAEFCPSQLVAQLEAHSLSYFDLDHARKEAEDFGVLHAVLWIYDRQGQTPYGMDVLDKHIDTVTQHVNNAMDDHHGRLWIQTQHVFQQLRDLVHMASRLCIERTNRKDAVMEDARELWFRLLHALMTLEHTLSARNAAPASSALLSYAQEQSRMLTQDVLASLVTSVSSDTVSFSHLFRRLVDDMSTVEQKYSDVRVVVEAMLSAYRLRCEVLTLSVRMNEADVARLFRELTKERGSGWFIPQAQIHVTQGTPHPKSNVRASQNAIHRVTLTPSGEVLPCSSDLSM